MPRKVVIESHDYGEYVGADFPTTIKKAVEEFAQYDSETFEIDLIQVDGYYLHENSIEQIQIEIEDQARQWRKEAELEYEGLRQSEREGWDQPKI